MRWKIMLEDQSMGEVQRQGYRLAWVKPDGTIFLFNRNAGIRKVKQAIMMRIRESVKFVRAE